MGVVGSLGEWREVKGLPWSHGGTRGSRRSWRQAGSRGSVEAGGHSHQSPCCRPLPCPTPLKSPWMWPVCLSVCHPYWVPLCSATHQALRSGDAHSGQMVGRSAHRTRRGAGGTAGEGSEKMRRSRRLAEGTRQRNWPTGQQGGLATAPGHQLLPPLSLVSISRFPKKLEVNRGCLPASEGPG